MVLETHRTMKNVCFITARPSDWVTPPGGLEVKARFSLCNQCYSEGKVPPSFKQEEYKFREYGSEAEAMKAKCVCFSGQSHKKPIAA
ncbi:hypothetical protein F2Q68_00012890 [Brassica cretica]|uniref:Uncharacterized protein n=1 Tax=Brassica cretica TaxID=69181 RepID=A0A8S9HSF1_BRACR|nr:hypothetical protein F2Q68_00012890 [Brassica cretica]